MKQFIVLAAILPILLVFLAQFTLTEIRSLRMNSAEDAIRAFCIDASYYDGGGAAEAEALRYKIAETFRCAPQEIVIGLSQIDEAHIAWEVSFPVGDIMAAGSFMGLSPSENKGRAQMSGTIAIAAKPPLPLPPDEMLPEDIQEDEDSHQDDASSEE